MKMKKIGSLFLALTMLCSLAVVPAQGAVPASADPSVQTPAPNQAFPSEREKKPLDDSSEKETKKQKSSKETNFSQADDGEYVSVIENIVPALVGAASESSDTPAATAITPNTDTTATIEEEGEYAWFAYTPTALSFVTFASYSDDDTYGYLYDSDMNRLAYNDDGGSGANFLITYTLQANQTYYFAARYYDDYSGSFTVRLDVQSILSLTPNTDTTISLPQSNSVVWFSYTPSETVTTVFSSFASGYDTDDESSLYATLCDADFESLKTVYGSPNFNLSYTLQAGETYYFAMGYDYFDVALESFTVRLSPLTFQTIAPNTDTTVTITQENTSVWFQYTPETNVPVCISSTGTSNAYVNLYNQSFSLLSQSTGSPNFSLAYVLNAGQTYYFEVGLSSGQTGSFTVRLDALNPPPLTLNTDTNVSITTAGNAVWFSYTPDQAHWINLTSADTESDTRVSVYSSADGHLATRYGEPDFSYSGRVYAGETYYFAVSFDSSSATGSFTIKTAKTSPPYGYVENQYLQFYVDSNGQYTLGTNKGNPDLDSDDNTLLLYGHPDPWSTETLLSVNGDTTFFHNTSTTTVISEDGMSAVSTSQWGDIEIKQILTFETNAFTGRDDIAAIRYEMTNKGAVPASLGGRIMLDTMLAGNDGAPFRVNGLNVTTETEFSGNDVPQYWQCFDSYNDTKVFANGTFFTNDMERPDRVQFVDWGHISSKTTYLYSVSSGYEYDDSAVVSYFDEKIVAPGSTRTFTTWYGIGEFSESSYDDNLSVSITAPRVLSPNNSGGYISNPFKVTAYVENKTDTDMTNVQATLQLDTKASLTGGSVSTVTIPLVRAGTTENCSWDVFVESQTEITDLNSRLSVNYAGGSLALPFKTVLNAVNTAAATKSVTYDLNYQEAEAPVSTDVMYGTVLTKPADPQRPGYTFRGWFANEDCLGIDWFNQFGAVPAQNRVESNITLFAKWEAVDKTLLAADVFTFSAADEFHVNTELLGAYRESLLAGLTPAEQQLILQNNDAGRYNKDFGMAMAIALMKARQLNPGFYDASAKTAADLESPKNSAAVAQLIEYYTLLQYTVHTMGIMADYSDMTESEKIQAVTALMSSLDAPLVLTLSTENGPIQTVAYDQQDDTISLWNTADGTFEALDTADMTMGGVSVGILAAYDVTDDFFTAKNPEQYIRTGSTQAEASTRVTAYLIADYAGFTVTHSNGKTASVNGTSVAADNDLGITFVAELPGNTDDYHEYIYAIPALTGDETLTVTTPSGNTWQLQYLYADAQSGSLQRAGAGVGGTIVLGASGFIRTELEQNDQQTVSSTVNNSECLWDTLTMSGSASELSVQNASDSTQIGASSNPDVDLLVFALGTEESDVSDITVQLSNQYGKTTLPPFAIGTEPLSVLQSENSIIVQNQDGESIVDADLTYTVVFNTRSGSLVAPATGLKSGDALPQPANPTLFGYNFNGWYTAEGLEWNFEEDTISGDMVLYASWVQDRNTLCSVIFTSVGSATKVMILPSGTNLTAMLPKVPERTGRIGLWNLPDHDGGYIVTSDLTVQAMYYGEGNTCLVEVTCGTNGSVRQENETEPWTDKEFDLGGTLALEIIPDRGYVVGQVLVNDEEVSPAENNVLSLTLDQDLVVSITFVYIGIPIESVSLSVSAMNLIVGQTSVQPLTVTYEPADNTDPKNVVWSSSNRNIAEVSTSGIVTAKSSGTATITATIDGEHTATCLVTVTKANASTPNKPTLHSKTPNSVTLNAISGAEYSRNGTTWQSGTTFTGLSPNTAYTFYARFKETATHKASPASPVLSVTTDKGTQATPVKPTLQAKTHNSVTLNAIPGAEYSRNGTTWQSGTTFTGLSPNTAYTFYARFKETATHKASPASPALSESTNKGTQATPRKPSLKSKTQNRVVLKTVAGAEYSRNGTTWQSGATFKNLKANTTYTFYVRLKATSTHNASSRSTGLKVTTNKKLKISTQPKARNVKRNKAATLKVKGQGGTKTLKYQWYTSNKKNSGFKKATGTTAKKANFKAPTKTKGTRYYRCVVTDGAGIKVTSKTVKVVVK